MDEKTFIAAKMAQLDKLIELLYVTEFERQPEPISAARKFSEYLIKTETPASGESQEISLLMSENMQIFVDRVISNLQRRGHQA
jgi:hypothetical protein